MGFTFGIHSYSDPLSAPHCYHFGPNHIISSPDYCNSILSGLCFYLFSHLESILNVAVKVIFLQNISYYALLCSEFFSIFLSHSKWMAKSSQWHVRCYTIYSARIFLTLSLLPIFLIFLCGLIFYTSSWLTLPTLRFCLPSCEDSLGQLIYSCKPLDAPLVYSSPKTKIKSSSKLHKWFTYWLYLLPNTHYEGRDYICFI